jgi:hypothetical protein
MNHQVMISYMLFCACVSSTFIMAGLGVWLVFAIRECYSDWSDDEE